MGDTQFPAGTQAPAIPFTLQVNKSISIACNGHLNRIQTNPRSPAFRKKFRSRRRSMKAEKLTENHLPESVGSDCPHLCPRYPWVHGPFSKSPCLPSEIHITVTRRPVIVIWFGDCTEAAEGVSGASLGPSWVQLEEAALFLSSSGIVCSQGLCPEYSSHPRPLPMQSAGPRGGQWTAPHNRHSIHQ